MHHQIKILVKTYKGSQFYETIIMYPFYIKYFSLMMTFKRSKHFVLKDYILSCVN